MSVCLLVTMPLNAQEKFDYTRVVAPPIKAMSDPKLWEGDSRNIGALNIPISTADDLVQQHVRQGFALLHAQWDVEAYRHFVAALKREPDCLMAYCGVVMSLLNPEHEWKDYRAVAVNRMLTLAEHKSGEGDAADFVFPTNERDYAIAIGSLVVNGMEAGAASFNVLAEKYPNDLQLALFAPFFNRGKYDVFGSSDEKQYKAVNAVKKLLDENPDNPLVANFYVMMQIEAPYNALNQKDDVLPYAKNLVRLGGEEFPCWQMMQGFSAWRAGDLELARDSYEEAVSLYEAWKLEAKAEISECDGLLRAYRFLAVIYYQMGDEDKSEVMLNNLARGGKARKTSDVYKVHDWCDKMMPVNMFISSDEPNAIKEMLKSLPKIESNNKSKDLYNTVIKAYQAYGLTKSYMNSGEVEKFVKMSQMLSQLLKEISLKRSEEVNKKHFRQCTLLLESLKLYTAELTAEHTKGAGVYSFYREAIDKQMRPSRYFPPSVLYPVEYKLAKYYEKRGDLKKARETYKAALKRMPSHRPSKMAYDKLMALLEG